MLAELMEGEERLKDAQEEVRRNMEDLIKGLCHEGMTGYLKVDLVKLKRHYALTDEAFD